MTVMSWQFMVFAIGGAIVFNLGRAAWWRSAVWLVLNLAFLGSLAPNPLALLPFGGFLLLGYLGILAPQRGWRAATPLFVVLVLVAFVWLKRYIFVPAPLLLPPVYLTVGMSYVFFRVMHLVIDVGQGAFAGQIGPLSYLNYTLNFPSLVSGPIQRYGDYYRMQTEECLSLTEVDIGRALWRIVLGAFKVLILSPALHTLQHQQMAALMEGAPPAGRILVATAVVAIYPLFLWANFSGFIDFVIGIARLYRLRLPENFDHPFAAPNFIDFWNRWHITLSQWLKTYVFNPLLLALMRRTPRGRLRSYVGVLAFFVTFFLVGAWHGQTSEFLFFGVLQGGGVAVNKLWQIGMADRLTPSGYARLCANPVYRAVARGLTFTWFTFTLLWFWSSWGEMGAMLHAVGFAGVLAGWAAILALSSVVLAVPDITRPLWLPVRPLAVSRYTRTAAVSAMVLAIVVTTAVLNLASPEIVYKNF